MNSPPGSATGTVAGLGSEFLRFGSIVFVGGVLIPIRYLINGCTVVQERVAQVAYCHVELPAHDVILAEGLPCESYLATGNRVAFVNGGAEMVHGENDLLTVASTSYAPAMARHIAS